MQYSVILILILTVSSCRLGTPTDGDESNPSKIEKLITSIEGSQRELIQRQIKENKELFVKGAGIPYYLSVVENGLILEPNNLCTVKISVVFLSEPADNTGVSISSENWQKPIQPNMFENEENVTNDLNSLFFSEIIFHMNYDEIGILRGDSLSFSQKGFVELKVFARADIGEGFLGLLGRGKKKASSLATLLSPLESR